MGDAGIPLSTLWSAEIAKGHGAARRSSTRRQWWWWVTLFGWELGRKPQTWRKVMAAYRRVDGFKLFQVTCRGLIACTRGSASGPTLGNEYGRTFLLIIINVTLHERFRDDLLTIKRDTNLRITLLYGLHILAISRYLGQFLLYFQWAFAHTLIHELLVKILKPAFDSLTTNPLLRTTFRRFKDVCSWLTYMRISINPEVDKTICN